MLCPDWTLYIQNIYPYFPIFGEKVEILKLVHCIVKVLPVLGVPPLKIPSSELIENHSYCVSKRVCEFLWLLMRQFYDAELQYFRQKIGTFKKILIVFLKGSLSFHMFWWGNFTMRKSSTTYENWLVQKMCAFFIT